MQADEHAPHPGPHLSDAEFELQLQRVLRRSRDESDDDMARDPTASSSGGAPRPAAPAAPTTQSTSSSSSGSP
eukprot:7852948-Pyramimonas_sp.AAC.1